MIILQILLVFNLLGSLQMSNIQIKISKKLYMFILNMLNIFLDYLINK